MKVPLRAVLVALLTLVVGAWLWIERTEPTTASDAATAELMQVFYTNVYEKDMDKATALREAILQMKDEYVDPSFWAAFTLIGES